VLFKIAQHHRDAIKDSDTSFASIETNLVSFFEVTAMVRTQIKTGLWLVVSTADF
jgi:hypothetical protein